MRKGMRYQCLRRQPMRSDGHAPHMSDVQVSASGTERIACSEPPAKAGATAGNGGGSGSANGIHDCTAFTTAAAITMTTAVAVAVGAGSGTGRHGGCSSAHRRRWPTTSRARRWRSRRRSSSWSSTKHTRPPATTRACGHVSRCWATAAPCCCDVVLPTWRRVVPSPCRVVVTPCVAHNAPSCAVVGRRAAAATCWCGVWYAVVAS